MSYTLFTGDCLDVMQALPEGRVDLVLCDPPYGVTSMAWDNVLNFEKLWAAYRRVLSPTGCVLLFGVQPFTSAVVMSNLPWFKQELVWDKNKCGSPGLAKVRPMQVHENVLVFAPGRTTYNPQMEKGEPYARRSKSPEGYVGRINNHGYGMKPRAEFTNEGTRYPKSIIRISRDFSAQQQVHPTQKPVPLLSWLIRTYSNPGDMVMDNCMGSGSTGVAARLCGREFIGIETDAEYVEMARNRIEHVST